MDAQVQPAADGRGIVFTGNWKEFLPIAATNALLIVCTLGIYRFWAAARTRRYLWSRTRVIDDYLEWTGTGREMFLGFLIVVAVIAPFYLFFQFAFPALIARGKETAAFSIIFLAEIAIFYFAGFARFRALRYRLSRSWWHGIRGGSNDPGWSYGGEYLGRNALSFITLFIMFPWSATHLWNSRWNAMSFGQLGFRADVDTAGLKWRWALVYLVPIGLMAAIGLLILIAGNGASTSAIVGVGVVVLLALLAFYIGIPLLTLHWFAGFYRQAAAATRLGNLEFEFDATTWQWLGLFIGNIALAIVTLGFGLTFWSYRSWAFMTRHLHIYGTIQIDELSQSTTRAPVEAEGWADAFDVGAI